MSIINDLTQFKKVCFGIENIKSVYAGDIKIMDNEQPESFWTQPVLSSDGVMGGRAFAAHSPNTDPDDPNQAFRVFDSYGKKSSCFLHGTSVDMPLYLEWYNPKPLKILQIAVTYSMNSTVCSFKVQASTDYINWIDIFDDGYGEEHVYLDRDPESGFCVTISLTDSRYFKY